MAPRQLVHSSTTEWLDLRCQGDGYVVIDNQTNKAVIDSLPGNNKPTSCQIVGSKDFQNIEFGFSMCATIGAQWILQKLEFSMVTIQIHLHSEWAVFRKENYVCQGSLNG